MIFRGKAEWMQGGSPEFEWVKAFNDKDDPMVPRNTMIEMILEQAYGYVTKNNEPIVGLLIRARADLNLAARSSENPSGGYPLLAGRYMVNNIQAYDEKQDRYYVDHQMLTTLDVLNHIIDLNKPDALKDDGSGRAQQPEFQAALKQWRDEHWITSDQVRSSAVGETPLLEGDPLALIDGQPIVFKDKFLPDTDE